MKTIEQYEAMTVGRVDSHFLDSGAFTLWSRSVEWAKENPGNTRYGFYDSTEFWHFIEGYAKFIEKWHFGIDHFANVDVLPKRTRHDQKDTTDEGIKLTRRNQKWLEDRLRKTGRRLGRELIPVPVVHYKTDLAELRWYIEAGYKMIGLGGLVGSHGGEGCRNWIDRAFDIVCDNPQRLPAVKLHGFGVTSYELMIHYPWFSFDSTTWTKKGAYGYIMVPHKRHGEFVFDEQPYTVTVSVDSSDRKNPPMFFPTLAKEERKIVTEWLERIEVPLGDTGEDNKGRQREVVTFGVRTRHTERRAANLLFFEEMRKAMPNWPWAFHNSRGRGFGFAGGYGATARPLKSPSKKYKSIIYYSGDGAGYSQPEILPEEKNLMLTYWNQQKKPNTRFREILKLRKD